MIEVGILKSFDSGTYKAGVQLAGSLTTYFDDISVARNIPSSALVIGNYVILAMPGGNPRDACVIATWPGGGLAEQSSACAYLGSDQTIATHTLTTVQINTEIWDIQGEFDNGTYRFVATKAGLYLAIYGFRYSAGVDGSIFVGYVRKNGTIEAGCQGHASCSGAIAQMAMTVMQLAASDYIDAATYQNSGSNKVLTGGWTCWNRLVINKLA
jgi:hypothetical protein